MLRRARLLGTTLTSGDLRAYAARAVLVATAYFASAKLGLALAYAQGNVTAVWPPAGIALAVVVVGGYRFWPAVALGALLANATTDVSILTAVGIATGNTLEALAGAALLRRAGFRPSLDRVRDVVALVVCAALSTAVAASIGNVSLLLDGAISPERFGFFWRLWSLGDLGGDLLVAPVLLLLASPRAWPHLTRRRVVEAATLTGLVAGISALALSPKTPFAFLAFPGLVAAALRFRQIGAAVASLLVAALAVWITARGGGPFANGSPDEGLLQSQTFFGVGALTALLLAAVLAGRERAEQALRRSHRLLDAVTAETPDPVYVKDAEGRYLMANPAAARMLGRPINSVIGRTSAELLPPELARELSENDRAVLSSGRSQAFEEEIAAPGGARTFLSVKSPLPAEGREVAGVIAISHDISERKRTEDRQRLLAETSRALGASLESEQTLRAVARSAVPKLGDWCMVHMIDDHGGLQPVAIAHANPADEALLWELARRYPAPSEAPIGPANVVRTGRSELLRDVPDSTLEALAQDEGHLKLIRSLGVRSAIVAPLRARGRTLGALALASAESDRRFDERDLRLAEELAARCGLAADNARLYRHEHTVAETLQRSLLPDRLPQIAGLQFAARYLPRSAGVAVGGDWYDAIQRPDGSVLLVIGDVCGHGLRAASTMGQLRTAVRAYALEERSPAAILTALNRLTHAVDLGAMVTMLCVDCDPMTNRLQIANGGHPQPLVVPLEGDVRTLACDPSLPLHVDAATRFTETEARLEAGSTLLLYTDGLVERTRRTLAAGLRALELAAAEAPPEVEALCDYVAERMLGDAERRDDAALLAVQALPARARRFGSGQPRSQLSPPASAPLSPGRSTR